jgi:hypothetical protein
MVQVMIGFKQFINEEDESTFNLEKFKKDCAPFLELLKGTKGKKLLYRGDKHAPKDFDIREWHERKRPVDMPSQVHDVLNGYFWQKYGEPFRNWTFGSGDIGVAGAYGDLTAIFPIGKFEWFGTLDHRFSDLTQLHSDIWNDMLNNQRKLPYEKQANNTKEKYELTSTELINDIENSDWEFNTNFLRLLSSTNEIMWKCDKYYAFNISWSEKHEIFLDEVKPFLDTL